MKKVSSDFEDKKYKFNHISEMNIITLAEKMDMSFDLCIKHNMISNERKLNVLINKNKSLINQSNGNCRHHLIKKVEHVPSSNEN